MECSDMLRLHHASRRVRVLGPGVRYVIWVQGCGRGCPGCATPQAQDPQGGYDRSIDSLVHSILSTEGVDGLTISGGEPFLQSEKLARLIDAVREQRDLGVIVYTGYVLEELQSGSVPHADALLSRTDLLIDGPYVDALNDDGALRGSSNQRAIALTDRYAAFVPQYGEPGARKTELGIREDGFFLTGVPSRATAALLAMGQDKEDQA